MNRLHWSRQSIPRQLLGPLWRMVSHRAALPPRTRENSIRSFAHVPEVAPTQRWPPLRVSLLSCDALTNLLAEIGNRKRPLEHAELDRVTDRIAELSDFNSYKSIAAACNALGGMDSSPDNAAAVERYVAILSTRIEQCADTPSPARMAAILAILRAFSAHQATFSWSRIVAALAVVVRRVASDDTYFKQARLSPDVAAGLLNPFQHVSALLDSEGSCPAAAGREGMVVAVKELLAAIAELLSRRASGRYSDADISKAFAGVAGMSNSHLEVRSVLRFLHGALHRVKPTTPLSASTLAACMGALFNMDPSAEPGGSDSRAFVRLLAELSYRISNADGLRLSLVGVAMTAAAGLDEDDEDIATLLLLSLTSALNRIGKAQSGAEDDNTYFPFQSFVCSLYNLGKITTPKTEPAVNAFLVALCDAWEKSYAPTSCLTLLTVHESATYAPFTQSMLDAACLGMYGLRELDGNSEGVRRTLYILRKQLLAEPGRLSPEIFTYAVCGLSNMSSDCDEATACIQAISDRSPALDSEEYLSTEDATMCFHSLRGKCSDSRAVRSLLGTIVSLSQHAAHKHQLCMQDSDVALACQGLEDMSSEDTTHLELARALLRQQLEETYKVQRGLAAGHAAVILKSMRRASIANPEALALLMVVAERLDESREVFTTEGAAVAFSGLCSFSNEHSHVRFLVSVLAKTCFVGPSANEPINNSSVAIFLRGFQSMQRGHGDEGIISALLDKLLTAMRLPSNHTLMSPTEQEECRQGLIQLMQPSSDSSEPLDDANRPLTDVLADIMKEVEQRCGGRQT